MLRATTLGFCLLSAGALLGLSSGTSYAEAAPSPALGAHRPHIKLDRLVLPDDWAAGREFETHLRSTLRREARRADWGAAGGKISYRFFVERLELREAGGVLHVACTALGRLPRGKSAKSQIEFGGDPRDRKKVVERVLDIVARGVVTRLAELERARRTP